MAGANGMGAPGAVDYASTASLNPGYYVTAPTAQPTPSSGNASGNFMDWAGLFSDDPARAQAARSRFSLLTGFAGSPYGPAQPFAALEQQRNKDEIARMAAGQGYAKSPSIGGSVGPAQVHGFNPALLLQLIEPLGRARVGG